MWALLAFRGLSLQRLCSLMGFTPRDAKGTDEETCRRGVRLSRLP